MRIGVASGLVAPGLLRSRVIGYAGDTTAPAGSTFRSEETGP